MNKVKLDAYKYGCLLWLSKSETILGLLLFPTVVFVPVLTICQICGQSTLRNLNGDTEANKVHYCRNPNEYWESDAAFDITPPA